MKKTLTSAMMIGQLGLVTAFSQVYTPPANSGGGGGSSSGESTTVVNQNTSQGNGGSNNLLGSDIPHYDLSNNVVGVDGKKFNLNDNTVLKSRFEKYLNSEAADSEDDRAYRNVIQSILDLLSPHNRDPRRFPKAVAQLQVAAKFPQDGRQSDALANALYRIFLAQKGANDLRALDAQLKQERKELDWKYDAWTESAKRRNRKLSESPDKKEKNDTKEAGHLARYVTEIAELEAQRVAGKAKADVTVAEAKIEFQALLIQLFVQRRFEHVIMAARIYTEFFKDGSGKLDFEKGSEVQRSFSESLGFSPTVTSLDTFANEAIRDVAQQIESFHFLREQGEVDGALRQLQQAFVTGEHLPDVQTVSRDDKREILGYAQNSYQLVNAIEVKDYTLAEQLVAEMKSQARDFDHSKPTAAVEGARLASNMRIRTAKNAALKGDEQGYQDNIMAAAEIWPTNPMLKEQFDLIMDSGDSQQQAMIEFDRLLSTKSYRQIFDNKARFIAATVDDLERQEALNIVIGNIQEIETVMKQAETLSKAGNAHAAWEIVEQTFQKFPDDAILSGRRSDLATDVATFVKTLKQAENLEQRKQYGSSLTWFLSAKQIYPHSEYAKEGMDRVIDAILPETEDEFSSLDGDDSSDF